jgi:hypothetical protein
MIFFDLGEREGLRRMESSQSNKSFQNHSSDKNRRIAGNPKGATAGFLFELSKQTHYLCTPKTHII